MATIGLKNLYVSKVTDTAGVLTYATPVNLAGAISADLTINYDEQVLYGDDKKMYVVKEFTGGELKINTADLSVTNQALLLGYDSDTDDVIYAKTDSAAPEFAVGFCARKPDGTYKFVWLYSVKFSAPADGAKTKGASVEFKTPELSGTISARTSDDKWKAEHEGSITEGAGATWFDAVREAAVAQSGD